MYNARLLLLSSALAAGLWGVAYGIDRWQVVVQVVCAVIASVSIFLAVLGASETEVRTRRGAHPTRYRPLRHASRQARQVRPYHPTQAAH
ncbi:MAG TPA: hypothetical protein VF132_05370 [Rudaea sp.]